MTIIGYSSNKSGVNQLKRVEDIVVSNKVIMGIDCSSTSTGIALVDSNSAEVKYVLALKRDADETVVRYRVYLKNLVYRILYLNKKYVELIAYEEPFISNYAQSSKVMLGLATCIEEILVEHESEDDLGKEIRYMNASNKSWKKALLGDKLGVGTEEEKSEIREYFKGTKLYEVITIQDMFDAMGIAVSCVRIKNGEVNSTKTKVKARFALEFRCIQADTEDEFDNLYINIQKKLPKRIRYDSIYVQELEKGVNLEDAIRSSLINRDTVVVCKINPKQHGAFILRNNLGKYVDYDNLYIISWRKAAYTEKH